MMKAPVRSRGFTLIELMITLTILGIMLAFGIPSFREFVANQKVKSAGYELMTAVLMARSEAVKRNASLLITPVSTTAWASGWSLTAGATTILQQQSMDGVTITPQSSPDPTTAMELADLTFGPTGRPNTTVYFQLTGGGTAATRCVKVDPSGIPTSSKGVCS
jgi:type IV fimbrial biogenesis protein FimT